MSRFGHCLIGVVILGWLVAPASADTIANFTLNGVTFDDGGTATGSFSLDFTTSAISNVNITTSSNGSVGANYTQTPPFFSDTFSNSPDASFDFTLGLIPLFGDELNLTLSAALTDFDLSSPNSFTLASGTESAYNFEFCGNGVTSTLCGSRSITAGSLDEVPAATPLPAALPLFASGLGVIGLLGWRRKRKVATTV